MKDAPCWLDSDIVLTYLLHCNPHRSWGHSILGAQLGQRVQGGQAVQGFQDSLDVLRDPGFLDVPVPVDLGGDKEEDRRL